MSLPNHIYLYENPDHRVILKSPATPVPASMDIHSIAQQMFILMQEANGIGLAGPQVGISHQIFVIHIPRSQPLVFVNPEILWTSQELSVHEEGCLSLPGLYARIQRPASVKIQARDIHNKRFTIQAEDLLATCIQHEYDHLNGILFTDHLPQYEAEKLIKKYEKSVRKRLKRGS
ncbi:MAG: peptide deformylase [Spirochaetia bacterium]